MLDLRLGKTSTLVQARMLSTDKLIRVAEMATPFLLEHD